MRAAIYARVSTRDKGQDTENQAVQLREFATRQGWEIVYEFTDNESGSTADRPQFKAMFVAASQRRFDVLLFWSLDRLSREGVLETLQHLNRLTAYGVAWRSFTEMYLDSFGPFRDAVLAILACIARQERIRIAERTKAGLARARERGAKLGRRPVAVDADLVRSLRAQGLSWAAVAAKVGAARATVQKSVA